MKKIIFILPILTALSISTVFAEKPIDKPAPNKNKGGPLSVFKRTSPMPLLMSVIAKNAEELRLNEEQNAVFTQWRVENMGPSLQIGNEIIAEEKAISQAALDGKSNAEVKKMLSSILEKRQKIASSMLTCRDMIIKTLDKTQWEKLVTLYNQNSNGMKQVQATEARLNEIAERGSHVMPFNLDRTVHVFSKKKYGGLQQVVVKNSSDSEQIKLIRQHLEEISVDFQQGKYTAPTLLHGENMPGLVALKNAKPNEINIKYSSLPDGAEITYKSDKANIIQAIHQWFDAQMSDHSRHAMQHHPKHQMHGE